MVGHVYLCVNYFIFVFYNNILALKQPPLTQQLLAWSYFEQLNSSEMLSFFYFESIKLSLVLFVSFFILLYFVFLSNYSLHPLIAGWLHLLMKWKPSISWFKNVEFHPNHHLSGLFIVSLLTWTRHFFPYHYSWIKGSTLDGIIS